MNACQDKRNENKDKEEEDYIFDCFFYDDINSNIISTKNSSSLTLNLFAPNKQYSSLNKINKKSSKIFKVLKPEFKCGMKGCGKAFMKKYILERHLKAHLNLFDKFYCNVKDCRKIYKQKENLLNHYKICHLNINPYKCGFCNSTFKNRNCKLMHERKYHSNFLKFKCTFIGKL
jgi:hypothetical protein